MRAKIDSLSEVTFTVGQCGNDEPTCETLEAEANDQIITALGALNVTGNLTRTFLSCVIVNCTEDDCNASEFEDKISATTSHETAETTEYYSGSTPMDEAQETTSMITIQTTESLRQTTISHQTTHDSKIDDLTATGTTSELSETASNTLDDAISTGTIMTDAITSMTDAENGTETASQGLLDTENGTEVAHESTLSTTDKEVQSSTDSETKKYSTTLPTASTIPMNTTASSGVVSLAYFPSVVMVTSILGANQFYKSFI